MATSITRDARAGTTRSATTTRPATTGGRGSSSTTTLEQRRRLRRIAQQLSVARRVVDHRASNLDGTRCGDLIGHRPCGQRRQREMDRPQARAQDRRQRGHPVRPAHRSRGASPVREVRHANEKIAGTDADSNNLQPLRLRPTCLRAHRQTARHRGQRQEPGKLVDHRSGAASTRSSCRMGVRHPLPPPHVPRKRSDRGGR